MTCFSSIKQNFSNPFHGAEYRGRMREGYRSKEIASMGGAVSVSTIEPKITERAAARMLPRN